MPKPVGRTPPVPDDGSSFDSVVAETSQSVTTKGLRAFLNRGWRTRPEEARGSHSIPPCLDVGFAVNQLQMRSVPTHPQLSASGRRVDFVGCVKRKRTGGVREEVNAGGHRESPLRG